METVCQEKLTTLRPIDMANICKQASAKAVEVVNDWPHEFNMEEANAYNKDTSFIFLSN